MHASADEVLFVLRGVCKEIALPPLSLFLVMLLGAMLRYRRPRLGGIVAGLGFAVLVLLSTPVLGSALLASLQTDPALAVVPQPAGEQAIVILGAEHQRQAPEFGGTTCGPMTLVRVRYGGRLARVTGLPVLVSGGPLGVGVPAVAELMRDALAEMHVVPQWVEARSLNTRENARETAAILARAGIHHVFLVTHAWHLPRARIEFERCGLKVTPAPTGFCAPPDLHPATFLPSAMALVHSRLYLHEQIGRAVYALTR